jgi:hypothetical protein
VEPKGELPIVVKRQREPKPKQTVLHVQPDLPPEKGSIIHGHYYDTETDVLYKESEFFGEFNFRDTILEQLDRYFYYLRRMKKYDKDSYKFYRKLGGIVTPYQTMGLWEHPKELPKYTAAEIARMEQEICLPNWFLEQRPSFGCLAYAIGKRHDDLEIEQETELNAGKKQQKWISWRPRFLYFVKYGEPPPEFQPMSGGDVYKLTIFWDAVSNDTKYGMPQEFGIFVSRDGHTIRVLRVIETKYIRVHATHKHKAGDEYFDVPQRAWHIPSQYERWAKKRGIDVELLLKHTFCRAVTELEHAQLSMLRVAVFHKGMVATFGVNHKRLSYFFQDRDIVLNENGRRERLFHSVKPHMRGDKYIPMHFRGVKEFTWAGYPVKITVPERDHRMASTVDIGWVDGYWEEDKGDGEFMYPAEIGKMFAPVLGLELSKQPKEDDDHD